MKFPEQIKINDYQFEGVRVFFEPHKLMLVYNICVVNHYSWMVGLTFGLDCVIVDKEYITHFWELCYDNKISPNWKVCGKEMHQEYSSYAVRLSLYEP